jgi:DNA-binding NtrC family response regulator
MYLSGMFKISRNGTWLQIIPEAGTGTPDPLLSWNCNSELLAELLVSHLRRRLGNKISEARQEAYAQGWKDAKAKRAKRTWFEPYFKKE